MPDTHTHAAIARVRRWHTDGCPLNLATTEAYADLDESDEPLRSDVGDVLDELALRYANLDGAQGDVDRLNNELYITRGEREQLRELAAGMLRDLLAMEHDNGGEGLR